MTTRLQTVSGLMRIFCLEDNPLIVMHIEQLIEDVGSVFAGSAESFSELKGQFASVQFDGALVDIDLADGRTGPDAAAWLWERGIRSIFVTAQHQVAELHQDVSIAVIAKPIAAEEFSEKIKLFSLYD